MTGAFKPSVCIDAVFAGQPLERALAGVKAAGIGAFEFWGWWDRDLEEVRRERDRHGMIVAACCTKFISLVDPACRTDYLEGLAASVRTAQELDCPTLISQVGNERPGIPREEHYASLVEGLSEAAPLLEDAGVTLVIEPLNVRVDHPGYYLVRSDEAFRAVNDVGSPRIKVVFDIYHQQISEGHLIANIAENLGAIGHFHAAGNPGRHELDRGEINYPEVFKAIDAAGYAGYVGLEYWPQADPLAGLKTAASWFH